MTAGRWMALAGAALGIVVALALLVSARAVQRTADVRNDLVDRLYPAEAATLRLTNALVDEESARGAAHHGGRHHRRAHRPAARGWRTRPAWATR